MATLRNRAEALLATGLEGNTSDSALEAAQASLSLERQEPPSAEAAEDDTAVVEDAVVEDADDEIEAEAADDAAPDDADEPEQRAEPVFATEPDPGARLSAEVGVASREQRWQAIEQLKVVLTDLRTCRQLLDEALNGTEPAAPAI